MTDKKKQSEDRNKYKQGYDVQFIAEDIFKDAIGHFIATNSPQGTFVFPTEEDILKLTEASIKAAIIFNDNKHRFGIKDRIVDTLEEE